MNRTEVYAVINQSNSLLERINHDEDKKLILLNMLFFRKTVYEFKKTFLSLQQRGPAYCHDPSQFQICNVIYLSEEAQQWSSERINENNVKEHICSVLRALAQESAVLQDFLWMKPEQIPIQDETLLSLYHLFYSIPSLDQKVGSYEFVEMLECIIQLYLPVTFTNSDEFYTPKSIVDLMVKLLNPTDGVIYDPCCKNGSMLLGAAQHILKQKAEYMLFGQENSQETWKLAQMLMHTYSIEADLGKKADAVFLHDLHPNLRADFVLGNPPFGSRNWIGDGANVKDDPRWNYGMPPKSNADFAWLQHMLYHAKADGRVSVVLTVSALYRENSFEHAIRRNMIEAGIIEAIITLPKGLFYNTQVATAVWVLNKKNGRTGRDAILFIDASSLGAKTDRLVTLEDTDCEKILRTFQAYAGGKLAEQEGFCRTVSIEEIAIAEYTLFPNHYIYYEKETVPLLSELETQRLQLQTELHSLLTVSSALLDDLTKK